MTGTWLHEGGGRMRREACNMDTLCSQLHHHEHVVRHQAMPHGDFHREEVRRREHLPVQPEELRPAHPTLPPLRSGVHMVAAQDITHRDRIDVMPQIRQGTLDTAITPGGILFGHADHELFDFFRHTGCRA
jgi:hypothetical protein